MSADVTPIEVAVQRGRCVCGQPVNRERDTSPRPFRADGWRYFYPAGHDPQPATVRAINPDYCIFRCNVCYEVIDENWQSLRC